MVVAGENGDGRDAAVARGLDIVSHVADECRFLGVEAVLGEDLVDDIALVDDAGVSCLKVVAKSEIIHLALEGESVHGSEDEGANAEGGAPFELFAGVWEDGDGGEGGVEGGSEMRFEFGEGDIWEEFRVKFRVRETEAPAEALAIQGVDVVFRQDSVGGFDDGAEVVHECAGPVENEIAEHDFGKI